MTPPLPISSFSDDRKFQIAERAVLNDDSDRDIMLDYCIDSRPLFLAILKDQGVFTCNQCRKHWEADEVARDGVCFVCDPLGERKGEGE